MGFLWTVLLVTMSLKTLEKEICQKIPKWLEEKRKEVVSAHSPSCPNELTFGGGCTELLSLSLR